MTIESILVSDSSEDNTLVAVAEESSREDSRNEQTTIDFKMVTFSLSGKDYAIDIMNVKEIAKAGNFTYVPNVLPFVVGVYNLRGEIIPILDMRLFFNIRTAYDEKPDLENLLILTIEEQTFGIIVDKIDKVVGVQKSSIQPPHPLFSDVNIKYISGVVESNKRLYILLDIERIFSKASPDNTLHTVDKAVANAAMPAKRNANAVPADAATAVKKTAGKEGYKQVASEDSAPAPVSEKQSAPAEDDTNYSFIVDGLRTYGKFTVSSVNESWVKYRFSEWKKERNADKLQIVNQADADAFLKPFWSANSGSWWSKEYADAIYAALPENSAKQVIVWNPGCGDGAETYCLACVLAKRYPNSKVRVYAQDIDLLGVSNAPLLSVPESAASGWLEPYLIKNAAGKSVFSKEIKDSIMFEYHDCLHTNTLPMADIIFARDFLSLLEAEMQKNVITDFSEKLKGNGTLFVGDNEELGNVAEFCESTAGSVTVYKKQ